MHKTVTAAQPQIKSYDPIWSQVRREAEEISAAEPALAASSMRRCWTMRGSRMPSATGSLGGSSMRR